MNEKTFLVVDSPWVNLSQEKVYTQTENEEKGNRKSERDYMQYIRNKDYNNNNDDDDDDDDETVIQMKCLTCDISLKSEKQREEKIFNFATICLV